jgi:hypothetical protein
LVSVGKIYNSARSSCSGPPLMVGGHANGVIGRGRLSGVLLLRLARKIGGDTVKHARDLRLGSLIARHDPHDHLRPWGDLSDVVGRDLCLHYKLISTGHDLHDRFAVADHATITGPHLSSAASAAEPTPSASTRLLEGELEGVEYALGVSYSDS